MPLAEAVKETVDFAAAVTLCGCNVKTGGMPVGLDEPMVRVAVALVALPAELVATAQ